VLMRVYVDPVLKALFIYLCTENGVQVRLCVETTMWWTVL